MNRLERAMLENPNLAAQGRKNIRNPLAEKMILEGGKFILGETPSEMALNAALTMGGLPFKLGAGALSLMTAADDANAGMVGRAGRAATNKIASIIDDITRELATDNDNAERAAKIRRMVSQVNDDAAKLQQIHKSVFPKGAAVSAKDEARFLADSVNQQSRMNAGTKAALTGVGGLGLMAGYDDAEAGVINKLAKEISKVGKKKKMRSTELPDIRTMPFDDAINQANKEQHLIKSGDQSDGYYVGSPRNVKSKRELNKLRQAADDYVAQDTRGMDWYDRTRNFIRTVTGGNKNQEKWMAKQQGQWSAGVDPGSELHFTNKENIGSLMGMPVKAARPAQHKAHLEAIAKNDPSIYQLGEKTGQYAEYLDPNSVIDKATGVNDFRNARHWGYTEVSGDAQKAGLTPAQHKFIDNEVAMQVDRANKAALGGRTDWTGPKIQAAPWVRQKAIDLLKKEKKLGDYETAFKKANKTLEDFAPPNTANVTYEAHPGASTGHLPLSVNASQADRYAYAADPRSTWGFAPGGRDAIYAGLQLGETGVAPRVLPTEQMSGLYRNLAGGLERNPGEVARPMVSFQTNKGGPKTLDAGSRTMLDTGEHVRAAIDAQEMGGAHIGYAGGPVGKSNSLTLQLLGDPRGASDEALMKAAEIGQKYGIGDVVDTGRGLTMTNFGGAPKMNAKANKAIANELKQALPDYGMSSRVAVDSVSADLAKEWQQGVGSGAVTKKLLEKLNINPTVRGVFDSNPYIPTKALGNIERDKEFAKWGASREDVTNLRKIIGAGPGWIARLEAAVKAGTVLPALGAVVLTRSLMGEADEGGT